MVPQHLHDLMELQACYIKMDKIGSIHLLLPNEHRQWAFNSLKTTQAEIKQLQLKLARNAVAFTALKFQP